MNSKAMINILGKISMIIAVLMLIPLIVVAIYGEEIIYYFSFLIPAAALFAIGFLASRIKPEVSIVYTKESMAIVALVWLIASGVGALPFVISGSIPSYIDAFFETVSGYTTTGASILTDVEALSHSMLFWRSFLHYIGGMGILVFAISIIQNYSMGSSLILKQEMPGHSFDKPVPKLGYMARMLYIIYGVFFLILTIALVIAGMPVFDAILHAFGTAGTGGFGIKSTSIGYYNSAVIDYIIGIGMLVFGVNFNLYFAFLIQKNRKAFKSEELRNYILIVALAIILIVLNIGPSYDSYSSAFRDAFFTVSSIITTTGYSINDFNLWPNFSKMIVLLLMFIGGCAGSTAGGLKVSRVTILVKSATQNLKKMLNPNRVSVLKFEGKKLKEDVAMGVKNYFVIYAGLYVLFVILISLDTNDFETAFSAVAATYNNIGPGLGEVGPMASFAELSKFSKFMLSFAMLLGRLEIYPLILLFQRGTWDFRN